MQHALGFNVLLVTRDGLLLKYLFLHDVGVIDDQLLMRDFYAVLVRRAIGAGALSSVRPGVS
jgi:hypothetical protein